jgi:hypothetical protein
LSAARAAPTDGPSLQAKANQSDIRIHSYCAAALRLCIGLDSGRQQSALWLRRLANGTAGDAMPCDAHCGVHR